MDGWTDGGGVDKSLGGMDGMDICGNKCPLSVST